MNTGLIHDELESRAVKHNLDCTTGSWTEASLIRDGVQELRLKAASSMRPYLGSKKCAIVACERGAAITWCNDVGTFLPLPFSDPLLEQG
jgi:putative component of toxin-antitoxin plasmid stabilization module